MPASPPKLDGLAGTHELERGKMAGNAASRSAETRRRALALCIVTGWAVVPAVALRAAGAHVRGSAILPCQILKSLVFALDSAHWILTNECLHGQREQATVRVRAPMPTAGAVTPRSRHAFAKVLTTGALYTHLLGH